MTDEKRPTEYEPVDWGTYQTGSTEPPKSHGAAIAFLLGLVIFLCSIVTALGLMNIKLTRQLADQSEAELCSISFSQRSNAADSAQEYAPLGFTGQTVSDFWRNYHGLPQGIYITDTVGEAAQKGLCAGDILLQLDGLQVCDWQSLTDRLAAYTPGDIVRVTVYREGSYLQYRLTLAENLE